MEKIFKYTAIVLFFAGCFCFCAEKGGEEPLREGEVPYKPCPCEIGWILLEEEYVPKEAYLFKDSIPKEIRRKLTSPEYLEIVSTSCWIVVNSELNSAWIEIRAPKSIYGWECNGEICNFPDFAKEWDIPVEGCLVDIEGIPFINLC